MTNAQIIARIVKLAPIAPEMAQREADIHPRSREHAVAQSDHGGVRCARTAH
jgi:hypothetical protein